MEVLAANHEKEGLCGGTSNCVKKEDHQRPTTTSCLSADEVTTESKYYKEKKSETTAVFGKSEANGFFRRTLKSILKIDRNNAAGSYDMDCVSTQSSLKEGYFSESEDKSDGIDSGIASEPGDRAASSRLSSCTNYTSKTHILSRSILI